MSSIKDNNHNKGLERVLSGIKTYLRIASVCIGIGFTSLPVFYGGKINSQGDEIICVNQTTNQNIGQSYNNIISVAKGNDTRNEKATDSVIKNECYKILSNSKNYVPPETVALSAVGSILFIYFGFRGLDEEEKDKRQNQEIKIGTTTIL